MDEQSVVSRINKTIILKTDLVFYLYQIFICANNEKIQKLDIFAFLKDSKYLKYWEF